MASPPRTAGVHRRLPDDPSPIMTMQMAMEMGNNCEQEKSRCAESQGWEGPSTVRTFDTKHSTIRFIRAERYRCTRSKRAEIVGRMLESGTGKGASLVRDITPEVFRSATTEIYRWFGGVKGFTTKFWLVEVWRSQDFRIPLCLNFGSYVKSFVVLPLLCVESRI